MKNMKWLILVAMMAAPLLTGFAQAPGAQAPVTLSPPAAEVVKLAQSGTSDDVLLAYIQNSSSTFSLSADQILYLKDVGVSSAAISSMLNRDAALRNQPQQYSYEQKNYPPTSAPAPEPPAPEAAAPVATEAPPPVAAPAPTYVSSPPPDVSYFYQDLSPYGTWVDLPGSGWCWQPTVVVANRGWRPYCDSGHWVWSDAGWFWASDYSWGWAPFHYGRWFLNDRCGWVWAPDRVWGPAWVTWRSSGDVCGWAPLPPRALFDVRLGWSFNGVHVGVGFDFGLRSDHFTFIGIGDFCARDLGHRRMGPTEVTRVYNRTTVINNYVVNNNTIINQGIKVERVAAATHTEIHKASIRDLPAGSPRGARQAADKSGPVLYRPQLGAPAKPVRMVAQKLDERHPVIQHTEMAPVRTETKSTYSASRSAPAATPGSRPYEAPRTAPRATSQQPATSRPDYSSPKSHQPSSSSVPAGNRALDEARPVARSAAAPQPEPARVSAASARQPMEEVRPATRSTATHSSAVEQPTYEQRTGQRSSAEASAPSSREMVSHTYYPKSYRQAADVRALPPVSSHDNGTSSSANHSGSSKKN
jgi:hypothetical protein